MDIVLSPAVQRLAAVLGAMLLLLVAVLAPEYMIMLMPLLVLLVAALALYQFPVALVVALVLVYGLAIDIQLDLMVQGGSASRTAALGAAVVKVVPFAVAAVLILRYGFSRAPNWPFLAFTAIAGLSIAILPIGRVAGMGDMARSFIGSAAPFALGFALAPRRIWTTLCRGVAFVPIISAGVGLLTGLVGLYPAFDEFGRFQGLHSPPFLAGFCTTAIFAATLEYLRGFRMRWLIVGGLDLAILLATQARAPFGAVVLFLVLVFFFSGPRTFPLKRKVDLVMGGLVPGMLLLGPFLAYALDRFTSMGENYSGRDIIWPYFLDAIETRPLFGFGLGAGKLIVNPDDPMIRLIGSSAAHNEYLRLSVDAGIVGCAMIFLSIILWVWSGTRQAKPADKLVLRAALAAALMHSGFDNTLIASTAVMQFTWFAAALARARMEAEPPRHGPQRMARHLQTAG